MVILKVYMYMEIYIYIYMGTNPIDNSSKYIETIIILIKPLKFCQPRRLLDEWQMLDLLAGCYFLC